jgi:hypothetical protein
MNDPVTEIIHFRRAVTNRALVAKLQDSLVLAFIIGGFLCAALFLVTSLCPIAVERWMIAVGIALASVVVALIRFQYSKTTNRDAVFLIDSSFGLEDRVAASDVIIERGGPSRPLEEALIHDTADRLRGREPAAVVPFKVRRWYALSLVSMISLALALVPVRSRPQVEVVESERADIQAAGETLERAATELEKTVPPETETAALAKEQGEIGRGFRGVKMTRAEALRKLSALEDRIRSRRDLLAETRADEIVSLADRRLGSTLSEISAPRNKSNKSNDQASDSSEALSTATKDPSNNISASRNSGKDRSKSIASEGTTSRADDSAVVPRGPLDTPPGKAGSGSKELPSNEQQSRAVPNNQNGRETSRKTDSKNRPSESTPVNDQRDSSDRARSSQNESGTKDSSDKSADADEQKVNDQRKVEQGPEGRNPPDTVPTSLAEQAAKRLPSISSELLKKAAELRAKQLTPADIEKLRKAAESLSHELAQIGQSGELRKALEEMARQVKPEDLEQVARELGNQETIKKELEAAARLLNENQHAKETVAGIAGQIARAKESGRDAQVAGNVGRSRPDSTGGHSNSKQGLAAKPNLEPNDNSAVRPTGQGRESVVKGKLQQRAGGEYLYLQSRAGAGAARAPYSSAYPQYRREAERTVQRSQVPTQMRSVVRRYFEAINPDGKK